MDSLGGFYDPSTSTPRPGSPAVDSPSRPRADAAAAGPSAEEAGSGLQGAAERAAEQATEGVAGLENEVKNVMSGLGSFWGKVRKQATAAAQNAEAQYTKAQKDFTPLLSRAQQQLDTLSAQTKAELARLSEQPAPSGGQGVMIGADGMPIIIDDVTPAPAPVKEGKGKGVDRGEGGETSAAVDDASIAATATETPAAAAAAFFSKLSSSAAPQLQSLSRDFSSLQSNLQSNLSTNLHQLQSQLSHLNIEEELQQAQGYLHKGEHWLADFSAEVGKLAKDAVRVVPPISSTSPSSGLERSTTPGQSALSRRELLLYKLRTDPSLLALDPALPPPPSASSSAPDSREAYAAFVASLQSTLDGFDTPQWREKVQAELGEAGEGLQRTLEALTGADGEGGELSEEAFWGRYFFRKSEIEEEEGRRKKVLQVSSTQSDDDFSWDMDDEDSSPTSPVSASFTAPATASAPLTSSSSAPPPPSAPAPAPASSSAPAEPSPRASSETTTASSFDVVGEKSGEPSEGERSADEGSAEERGETEATPRKVVKVEGKEAVEKVKVEVEVEEKDEESEDSDWE